jgi:hypothetical protein
MKIFCRAFVQIDHASADRSRSDFRHVGVRTVKQVAAVGHGDHRERVRRSGRTDRGPFERIESNVDFRAAGTDLFTDVKHRCLVALTFANDDCAVDRERVEGFTHRVDCSLIGRLFVAAAGPARTIQCRRFGNADSFEG